MVNSVSQWSSSRMSFVESRSGVRLATKVGQMASCAFHSSEGLVGLTAKDTIVKFKEGVHMGLGLHLRYSWR